MDDCFKKARGLSLALKRISKHHHLSFEEFDAITLDESAALLLELSIENEILKLSLAHYATVHVSPEHLEEISDGIRVQTKENP